jgi:hypothetical protein
MNLKNFQNRFFIDVDEHGVCSFKNFKSVESFCSQFKGQRLIMELSVYEDKRTEAQNAYYFGVVIPYQIAAHKELHGLVLTKQQIHEFNKANFFAITVFNPSNGQTMSLPTSSTLYNTKEFNERLEIIRQYYLTNMNWEIPEPQSDEY